MTRESLQALIDILYESTGIHFTVDPSLPFDEESVTDERIKFAIAGLGKKISKAAILKQYLNGDISTDDTKELFKLSHFKQEDNYDMFLLSFQSEYDSSVLSILHNMTNASSWEIIKMSSRRILMINSVKKPSTADELKNFSSSIYDTLSTEALVTCSVSYDRTTNDFSEIPLIYQNLASAILIGSIFDSGRHIYGYHSLGLGKLIYSIPREAAQAFLNDSLPGIVFDKLDSETINTINTFFECGLNISETARMLYLHRNTFVYRLDKFTRLTGLDIRNFDDAVSCKVGMMISDYLKSIPLQNT